MKAASIFAFIITSLLISNSSFAQSLQTDSIKVWGNCDMCKETIEKAAKSAGANTADWNEDSHQLAVTYAAKKTSSRKIQQAVAKAGYDTQDVKASNSAYSKLPGCCKYDRKTAAPGEPAKQ